MMRRRTLLSAAAALAAAPAMAQPGGQTGSQPAGQSGSQSGFPGRPVRVLVPQAAGGFDVYARLIGPAMQASLGQPFVVDNKPGANGNIALSELARQAPDGHSLLLGPTGTLTANTSLYRNMPFDPVEELVPVTLATTTPMVWLTQVNGEISSLPELVRIARSRPGRLNYTFPGVGTLNNLVAEAFKQRHGLEIEGISVSGPSVSMTELMAGRVPVAVEALGSCMDYVAGGRLRPLAVTTRARSPQLPDVPTMIELGLEEREYLGWYAFVAPRGTPAPVAARLNAAINEALRQPDVTERLRGLGATAAGGTPEELRDFMRRERATWREVIQKAGIQPA